MDQHGPVWMDWHGLVWMDLGKVHSAASTEPLATFTRNKLQFPPKVLILLKRTCSATAVDCISTEYRHLQLKKTDLSSLLPLPENVG